MAITAEQKYLLNKMNGIASKVQLGTLLDEAGQVAAGEITLATGSILVGTAGVGAALDAKTSGQILVGNGTTLVSVAVSGDITLSSAGVAAIASGVIVNADVNASAAIDYSKMATMTGDVTMTANASAIGAGKVLLAMLGAGIAPSHVAKFGGTHTTAGGDAVETIVATGAVAGDLVVITVRTVNGTPRSVVSAVAGTDAITVTLSGDPSTDHVLEWLVFRAAA